MADQITLKQGDTLIANCVYKNALGVPVNLTTAGITVESGVRSQDGGEIYPLALTLGNQAAAPGTYELRGETSDWEIGRCLAWDIRYWKDGASKIQNLPASTAAGQPVVHEQLASAIEGLAWKDSVRVASLANINIASPGANIDGIVMAVNDRVLLAGETAGATNGIYIYNGAATPMTRAADASTAAELEQAVVTVEEGTSAGASFRQTVVNATLDTTVLTFTTFGTAAAAASRTTAGIAEIATEAEIDTGTDDTRAISPLGLAGHANRKRKAVGTIGDAAATQFTITHNFNMRDVQVEVYRNSGNYDTVFCDVDRPSVNSVRFTFATAPALNAFAYVILG